MPACSVRASCARERLPEDGEAELAGFDARLAERTEISTAREWELCDLDSDALREQAASVAVLLQRFADAVSAAHENPAVSRGFLQQLDLKVVSRDHDWRSVFRALATAPPGSEGYQLVALARYRQYLESRGSLIRRLLEQRDALHDTAELERPVEPRLVRLPARRPVLIPLEYRAELALWLGGHRFTVRDGFPPELQDPRGEMRWPLARHGLMVGRHPESDVVVDARFDQVSRAHAVVEWPGYTRIIVIDLSSGGTFLERRERH